jgi:hypothetical protein
MKTGFYPGCSLTGSARDYNESVSALAEAGINLSGPRLELVALLLHIILIELLPSRPILAIAEKRMDEIVAVRCVLRSSCNIGTN